MPNDEILLVAQEFDHHQCHFYLKFISVLTATDIMKEKERLRSRTHTTSEQIMEQKSEIQAKSMALTRSISKYEQNLGFDFERTENNSLRYTICLSTSTTHQLSKRTASLQ
jgi:hypothetical protein